MNDGCKLQTMPGKDEICEKSTQSDNKEPINANYITANCSVHKSFERSSIADSSVLSLKNYSTILHNSNNTLYKTHSSPDSVAKALERQTSTPMHDNLIVFKSPEPNGCSCSISSGSSQLSSITSSSESDTSPQAFAETTETR